MSEPNAGKGVTSIRFLAKLIGEMGIDPVFTIYHDDGTETNMLQTPGFVTQATIDCWEKDLLVTGVFKGDGNGARHAVCPFDAENLEWSGNTLLNSCTEPLSLHIQDALTAQGKELNGIQVFHQIISKCYRPSSASVRKAIASL